MFLEWWMVGGLSGFWLVSMIAHGHKSYSCGVETGAETAIGALAEADFIRITDEGDIIGLCNKGKLD